MVYIVENSAIKSSISRLLVISVTNIFCPDFDKLSNMEKIGRPYHIPCDMKRHLRMYC